MRVASAGILGAFLLVLLAAAGGMPAFGVPDAPAAQHVARYYLEHAYRDTHTPNVVTVMIGDYRSFDTLGEVMVVFAAGLACTLLLLPAAGDGRVPRVLHRKENLIAEVVTRLMLPAVQIFALYVVFHGHYSPGGGFQGGALLAASIILARIVLGRDGSQAVFPTRLARPLGGVGVLVYAAIGIIPLGAGGAFLQYDLLPLGMAPDMLHYWGILGIEIGVALTVMGILVSIFDDVSMGGQ
jgi:multicomponent Na+:H+ antiporter subunit B